MTDENLLNEERIESLKQRFDEALIEHDWDVCREMLECLEEMKVNTYELRREMNTEMADEEAHSEPDDFTNSTTEDYGL